MRYKYSQSLVFLSHHQRHFSFSFLFLFIIPKRNDVLFELHYFRNFCVKNKLNITKCYHCFSQLNHIIAKTKGEVRCNIYCLFKINPKHSELKEYIYYLILFFWARNPGKYFWITCFYNNYQGYSVGASPESGMAGKGTPSLPQWLLIPSNFPWVLSSSFLLSETPPPGGKLVKSHKLTLKGSGSKLNLQALGIPELYKIHKHPSQVNRNNDKY